MQGMAWCRVQRAAQRKRFAKYKIFFSSQLQLLSSLHSTFLENHISNMACQVAKSNLSFICTNHFGTERLDHTKAGIHVLSLRFFCSCYFLQSSVGRCTHTVLAWVRNVLLERNSPWSVLTVLRSYSQAALEHTENGASFLMELKQSVQPKGTPHALQLLRGVQFRGSDRDQSKKKSPQPMLCSVKPLLLSYTADEINIAFVKQALPAV